MILVITYSSNRFYIKNKSFNFILYKKYKNNYFKNLSVAYNLAYILHDI